jgi:hypothetical protein
VDIGILQISSHQHSGYDMNFRGKWIIPISNNFLVLQSENKCMAGGRSVSQLKLTDTLLSKLKTTRMFQQLSQYGKFVSHNQDNEHTILMLTMY